MFKMTQKEKHSSLQGLHFGLEVGRLTGLHGPVSDLEASTLSKNRTVELGVVEDRMEVCPSTAFHEALQWNAERDLHPGVPGPSTHDSLGLRDLYI